MPPELRGLDKGSDYKNEKPPVGLARSLSKRSMDRRKSEKSLKGLYDVEEPPLGNGAGSILAKPVRERPVRERGRRLLWPPPRLECLGIITINRTRGNLREEEEYGEMSSDDDDDDDEEEEEFIITRDDDDDSVRGEVLRKVMVMNVGDTNSVVSSEVPEIGIMTADDDVVVIQETKKRNPHPLREGRGPVEYLDADVISGIDEIGGGMTPEAKRRKDVLLEVQWEELVHVQWTKMKKNAGGRIEAPVDDVAELHEPDAKMRRKNKGPGGSKS
ncbi:hypothetical protein BC936DRAFT_139268 [Jimgerdemannia flammicorona]|uniref:Uncharacterized protein n=1 Tax=Jimgerdemannia flammicorona TaxID=994334 RepID=A0A433BA87_9FUNG|nr:hypothetical protein BC936DRAFT_139268 [Jimgerdemannia flammicorona]